MRKTLSFLLAILIVGIVSGCSFFSHSLEGTYLLKIDKTITFAPHEVGYIREVIIKKINDGMYEVTGVVVNRDKKEYKRRVYTCRYIENSKSLIDIKTENLVYAANDDFSELYAFGKKLDTHTYIRQK